MLRRIKLTDIRVKKLSLQPEKQKLYWDLDLMGFGLRVSKTSKSFFCESRVNKKTIRITIGKFPIVSTLQARNVARTKLADMTLGVDPREKDEESGRSIVTFGEVIEEFYKTRNLKPSTLKGYRQVLNKTYGEWHHLSVDQIAKDMIEQKHKELTNAGKLSYANLCARTIRSVLNFAMAKYDNKQGESVMTINPVDRISQAKLWNRNKRRKGHLKPYILGRWFEEVNKISNIHVRDFLIFTLLTGARKSEGSSLMWKDVSFDNRSFTIRDPKNGVDVECPVSDQLFDILINRHSNRQNDFVFPSSRSKSGHIEEPKKIIKAVGESIDYHFTTHDLRRTYITFAESLDISQYAVKALINHKLSDSDVTAGYIQISIERLREPMHKISDYIIRSSQV